MSKQEDEHRVKSPEVFDRYLKMAGMPEEPVPEPYVCENCGLPGLNPDLVALAETLGPTMADYQITYSDLADAVQRKPGGLLSFVLGATGQNIT